MHSHQIQISTLAGRLRTGQVWHRPKRKISGRSSDHCFLLHRPPLPPSEWNVCSAASQSCPAPGKVPSQANGVLACWPSGKDNRVHTPTMFSLAVLSPLAASRNHRGAWALLQMKLIPPELRELSGQAVLTGLVEQLLWQQLFHLGN